MVIHDHQMFFDTPHYNVSRIPKASSRKEPKLKKKTSFSSSNSSPSTTKKRNKMTDLISKIHTSTTWSKSAVNDDGDQISTSSVEPPLTTPPTPDDTLSPTSSAKQSTNNLGTKQPLSHHKSDSNTSVDSVDFFPPMDSPPPAPTKLPRRQGLASRNPTSGSVYSMGSTANTYLGPMYTQGSSIPSRITASAASGRRGSQQSSSTASVRSGSVPSVQPPAVPLPLSPKSMSTNDSSTTAVDSDNAIPEENNKQDDDNISVSSRSTQKFKPRASLPSSPAMGSNVVAIKHSHLEELKAKIAELEDILQKDKLERRLAASRFEHIQVLESALEHGQQERDQLVKLVHKLTVRNNQTTDENDESEESPVDQTSFNPLITSSLRRLSSITLNADEIPTQVVALQTELSVVTSDNRVLKNEKDHCMKLLKEKEEEVAELKTINGELNTSKSQLSDNLTRIQTELTNWKDKMFLTERDKMVTTAVVKDEQQKSGLLESKLKETEKELQEIKTKMKINSSASEQAKEQLERVRVERDELQHQVQGFKTGRKQLEQKIHTLEKELRQSKKIIFALEASLQDVKVSLEVRAMENDELNRSFVKVMQQANATLDTAKRSSLAGSILSASEKDSFGRNRVRDSLLSDFSDSSENRSPSEW